MFKNHRRRKSGAALPTVDPSEYPYRKRPEWAPMQFIGHVQGGRHTR